MPGCGHALPCFGLHDTPAEIIQTFSLRRGEYMYRNSHGAAITFHSQADLHDSASLPRRRTQADGVHLKTTRLSVSQRSGGVELEICRVVSSAQG